MKRAPLKSLQALRAIAALLVVLRHAQETFTFKAGTTPFGGIFSGGGRGVDLFFVLSGFIIMYTHARDWGHADRVGNYLFKRLSRIYPAVFIITGLTALLAMLGLGGDYTRGKLDVTSVIVSALLIPQLHGPLVVVTWTLVYEMFFYMVFLIVIVRPRLGLTLFAAWQIAIIGVSAFAPRAIGGGGLGTYLQPVCLEFAIGMGCALAVAKVGTRAVSPVILSSLLVVGGVAFAFGAALDTYVITHLPRLPEVAWFGGCSAAIVMSLVLLEIGGHLRVAGWIVKFGDASYAVYLVHFSALVVLSRVVIPLTHGRPAAYADVGCAVIAAGSIAVGIAFDRWVDRPIQHMLKRFAGGLRRAAPQAAPAPS